MAFHLLTGSITMKSLIWRLIRKNREALLFQDFPTIKKERETGLEPAASTLARSRSTN